MVCVWSGHMDGFCVICKNGDGQLGKVKDKGFYSLFKYSKDKQDYETLNYLRKKTKSGSKATIQIHNECRKNYTNKRRLSQAKPAKRTSSRGTEFDWKRDCFICSEQCSSKKRKRADWRIAGTIEMRENMLQKCKQRIKADVTDQWAIDVLARVEDCFDFVAAESRYHSNCLLRFNQNKASEKIEEPKSGRKPSQDLMECFSKACDWLEGEMLPHSVSEFREKIVEYADGKDVYGVQYIKKLLSDRYQDHISFCCEPGRENILYFKQMADYLINTKYRERGNTTEEESQRIITLAANLVKAEVREKEYKNDFYPDPSEIEALNWSPPLLKQLMKSLTKSDLKQEFLAQCIVKATKRDVIPPLLFALGVDLDQSIGSRWLVSYLSKLGASIAEGEVRLYRQSFLKSDTEPLTTLPNNSFVQWSADNVDHNLATLDGKGTFHGMGIIASVTPSGNIEQLKDVKRLKKRCLVSEVTKHKGVDIVEYDGSDFNQFPQLKSLTSLKVKKRCIFDLQSEAFWHSSWYFSSTVKPRPLWSGFMQQTFHLSNGVHYNKSDVILLPIIDLQPTNLTCIYSTLLSIQRQADQLNIKTPVVTFDQPLWYKAQGIIADKGLNIVCRLGGFHTLMSFMGSIGYMMSGSGLEEVWSQVYAENTIPHLMSGKAYSRALRGYILVHSALHNILLDEIISSLSQEERLKIKSAYDVYYNREHSSIPDETKESLQKIEGLLVEKKARLAKTNRTARLWVQLLDYIDTILLFIRAERLADWEMHLTGTHEMLNLFASTGHFHYAKSARFYLQQMLELPKDHPEICASFKDHGYHAIRRSERYWAGLWSDLVIEQVMMRAIKSRGGLTRGRGFDESTRHQWVHTAHYCAVIHQSMSSVTKILLKGSEQHEEFGKSRICRDSTDLATIQDWFVKNNPFDESITDFKSLSTGICDNGSVNCDDTEQIGKKIQEDLNGVCFHEVKIKRSSKVKNFESMYNSVKVDDKKAINIKPTALFLRLIPPLGPRWNFSMLFLI